jgi:leader peptidase (prepilin peptidase)/N-methyltransferase
MAALSAEQFTEALGFPLWPLALVLGLLVGSFLNVVIARLPLGESIVHPRSRCPKCGYMIPSWFNVPVVSWLVLRGRCWSCKSPIAVRYPVVELLTGVLFLACFTRFGLTWALLASWILVGSLMAIIFIDIDHFEIPDEITLPGILIGCLLRPVAFEVPWYSGLVAATLAAVALLGIRWGFSALRGIEGMGLGDVKLLAMIGAFLGPLALVWVLLFGSLSGIVVAVVQRVAGWLRPAAAPDAEPEPEPEPEQADLPSPRIRFAVAWTSGGRTRTLGAGKLSCRRTFARAALLFGARGRGRGIRVLVGLVHDQPGWGVFDGLSYGLGRRGPKLWLGALVGLREWQDEEDWVPPKNALPFGPFLAMGAMFTLLYQDLLRRWVTFLHL